MRTIPVLLGERSYDVHVGRGLLAEAGALLAQSQRARRVAIITDEHVAQHLGTLQASLAENAMTSQSIVLPPGESTKSWRVLKDVCDRLLALEIERGDTVIALGGGVIGDLAGFAAAILKRGCRFVQVPTSLLAQVDSSVGGKTGINTPAGKNLIGAFHQPSMVVIDTDLLRTLPDRELRAGYAEVLKYGLIDDPHFFAWCEQNGDALLAGDDVLRIEAVAHSVAAKARIVAADEHEMNGTRALLNLGHTFGHALEVEAGFDGTLLHGEAVAAGCALAFAYSAERGLCAMDAAERVAAHLRLVGLPDGLSAAGIHASGACLVGHMRHDKKMAGGALPFLLARDIGQTFLDRTVMLDDVAAFLDRYRR